MLPIKPQGWPMFVTRDTIGLDRAVLNVKQFRMEFVDAQPQTLASLQLVTQVTNLLAESV